jgi:hypothetical protein
MDYLSRIVFILTLMLLAKGTPAPLRLSRHCAGLSSTLLVAAGWTITPGELTHKLLIVGSVCGIPCCFLH